MKINHVRMRFNPVNNQPEFMPAIGVTIRDSAIIGISDVEGDKQKIIHIYTQYGEEFVEVFGLKESADLRHKELASLLNDCKDGCSI